MDVKGGQHPVWDAELRFPIVEATSDKYRKLEISCYAKESKSDDLLGQGIVDITETLRTGEFDGQLPWSSRYSIMSKPSLRLGKS